MKLYTLAFILFFILFQFSCKKFLEIPPPKDSLTHEVIFQNDALATAAITGIYSRMALSGFGSGTSTSVSSICGLSSDELISYNIGLTEFYMNQINPNNTNLASSLYGMPYQYIYSANSVLEGLTMSKDVTPPVKEQLQGEALFIRAFTYFYLVNLYGQVPLHLTTDYRKNQSAIRNSTKEIYQQILADLKTSEALLNDDYITIERIRPNVSTVRALLARTYLYLKDWENAEKYASLVIGKTGIYHLVNLDDVFLKNSQEAIWQLMPTANTNTNEGNLFILTSTPVNVSLNSTFSLTGFESNDNRRTEWIKSFTNNTGTYYYPYKYKIRSSTNVTEYTMVLRLAEQYLIRAEARANLDKLDGALADLASIRLRAGLQPLNNTIQKDQLLIAIQKERFTELFTEWGHRWLDLKRTGTANNTLGPIKQNWQSTDEYYPIPQAEINGNPNITQNPGY
jgi:hypothetical protein